MCAVCGIATDISERKRVEEALRAAALAVSTAEGASVFSELVRALATILRVDAAMIAVFVEGDPTRMRTLAARLDGNTLRDSASVEREPLAAQLAIGVAIDVRQWQATLGATYRTKEYETQDREASFGTLTFRRALAQR